MRAEADSILTDGALAQSKRNLLGSGRTGHNCGQPKRQKPIAQVHEDVYYRRSAWCWRARHREPVIPDTTLLGDEMLARAQPTSPEHRYVGASPERDPTERTPQDVGDAGPCLASIFPVETAATIASRRNLSKVYSKIWEREATACYDHPSGRPPSSPGSPG